MINTFIGKKIEQTQKFLENGKRVPVTQVSVADIAVTQIKTIEKEGYNDVQLGAGMKKKPTKAALGHAKKAGFEKAASFIKEIRVAKVDDLPSVGEMVAVEMVLQAGDVISVSGTSKGKGFAGVVKRHNFRGGPKTHGQSDRWRAPGSIGQTTTPGRVYRGKRMAGRMGSDTVTVPNLTVVAVDPISKVLSVAGLVPGHLQSMVIITKTGERKKFIPLLEEVEKAKIAAQEAADKLAAASNAVKEEVSEDATSNVATAQEEKAKEVAVEAEVEETKETKEAEEAKTAASREETKKEVDSQ